MKILVINCGSSSLKYQFIDMTNETVLAKGLCERIGMDKSFARQTRGDEEPVTVETELKDHGVALQAVLNLLRDPKTGVIGDVSEISAVGHRVVHGAEKFSQSSVIDDEILKGIKDCIEIAPLHNPPNIIGIEACMRLMPGTPNGAVFDTAFHQTMPAHAYLYALPYEYYEKYGVRKYGFHGTSHRYVSERAAALLGKPIEQLKLVTCHLGNGSSICAVDGGKSVETSMGYTPLDGLMMGTRCGSIDPAVVTWLMEKEDLDTKAVNDIMNKKSGIFGVSGVSSDFRDITAAAEGGNERARLGLAMFAYQVRKYIGQYAAAMGGIHAIVFTAGVGENVTPLRVSILKDLAFLGVAIDEEKNKIRGCEIDISADGAKVRTLVIPTNEELAIARDTYALTR
ncbi:MAG: acetate kinase [Clostridiales bacterium]|jgi:acetate kinase|nr:acetate kinase [Clostridiales bacterium]